MEDSFITSTRKRKARQLQNRISSKKDNLNIHYEIEQKLRDSAIRNNLTSLNVKAILKKVVRNDHVLAIVKLKEEELERCCINEENLFEKTTPKLTRLKAKELNKIPYSLKTLKPEHSNESVAAFITQDLASDDDDEEYHPQEDDTTSDDDISIHLLDKDKKLKAAITPNIEKDNSHNDYASYTNDGLFKIPQNPMDIKSSEENIALRTRSKLSLATTAIETIESTFIPPDITTDMYNFDYDIDAVWKEFLDEFTKPLNQNIEEDDDTDPEYVAADRIPYDKEELRDFKVSKKELNILITELLEMVNVEEEKSAIKDSSDKSISLDMKNISNDSINKSNQVNLPCSLNTLTTISNIEKSSNHDLKLDMDSYIEKLDMSRINNVDIHLQIPEIGFHYRKNILQEKNNNFKNITDQLKLLNNYLEHKIKVNRFKVSLQTHVPHNDNFLESSDKCFTEFQEKIYAQQIRMHIQLVTQHFIQTYSHPQFWNYAHKFKLFLTEIKNIVEINKKSMLNVSNLKLAIQLCEQWEHNLSSLSSANFNFYRFLENECKKAHCRKRAKQKYISKFHTKILDFISKSKVFIYPSLLPEIPFRPDLNACNILLSEEQLIAFGLEYYYKKIEILLNKYKPNIKRIPTIAAISEKISKHICKTRSPERIYKTIILKKSQKSIENPIKYYFHHNKAPPFNHVLEPVDLQNIIAPIEQDKELPKIWQNYRDKLKNVKPFKSNNHNLLVHAKLNKIFRKKEKFSIKNLFEEFHIYAEALMKNMDNITNNINTSIKTESLHSDTNKICTLKRPKLEVDSQDCSITNNIYKVLDNIPTPRKIQKKVHDNFRAILKPENEDNIIEKNALFARNFYEKVEETMIADGNEKYFNEFKKLLTIFNPETDKVAELYYNVEQIFLPRYPEFTELFLTFLLPGHAAQIGKFFEHFILTNMNTFMTKLNTYFSKQPAQIKKIISCINEISNDEEISIELIKSKITPLLKGNRLLIDWFLQFFPSESPTKNVINEYDFETINMRTLPIQDSKDETDVYEYLPTKEIILDGVDTPSCGLKYMQGHIYYGSRVLLPAKLSFRAINGERDTTYNNKTSDDIRDIECVHSIKEFGEQRLKEQLKQNLLNNFIEEDIKINKEVDVFRVNEPEFNEDSLKICDAALLKAHSIRLNPAVHGVNVSNHADILGLLAKTACYEESISKNSPNRITHKCLKKKPLSPNKKVLTNKQPLLFNKNETNVETMLSTSVQTSKKFKLLTKNDNSTLSTSPKKKIKHNKRNQINTQLNKTVALKQNDPDDSLIWTRDEDKIILEIIKENLYTEDELLSKLYLKLKTKTPNIIIERYKFLLEILTKFHTND